MKKLSEHIRNIMNLISFALGLGLNVFFWFFKSETSIPIWLFVIITATLWVALWLCAKLFLDKRYILKQPLSIIKFKTKKDEMFCLIKKNTILSSQTIVTFYINDGGFEQYLATGYVYNIQDGNGIVQVQIVHKNEEYDEILNNLCVNEVVPENITVKNNALFTYIKEIT